MSSLSSHILDISTGLPAVGVTVQLEHHNGHGYTLVSSRVTDDNGRIAAFTPDALPGGHYRLTAETGTWFTASGRSSPFLRATIEVVIDACEAHYHLPFLIAPGGWSTYRGS